MVVITFDVLRVFIIVSTFEVRWNLGSDSTTNHRSVLMIHLNHENSIHVVVVYSTVTNEQFR